MVRTYDPLARSHLGSWDLCLNKLSKGPPGKPNTKLQAFEVSELYGSKK